MDKLKVLDLFSGIGGFSLGLERTGGFETVAFCEIDPFCQKVLRKHWPDTPIVSDINKLSYNQATQELSYDGRVIYRGPIHLVCGGYPCQPFSVAGNRKGEEDDRHLWPAMFSLIQAIRPNWVIGENVVGHITMGLDSVLANLEGEDYTARTFVIPACALDAKHRRDRVWIVANSKCNGSLKRSELSVQRGRKNKAQQTGMGGSSEEQPMANASERRCGKSQGGEIQQSRGAKAFGTSETIPNTPGTVSEWSVRHSDKARRHGSTDHCEVFPNPNSKRGRGRNAGRQHAKYVGQSSSGERGDERGVGFWLPEPSVGRVAHGVPRRVDRLRSLGNSVVHYIPEKIGNAILESISNHDT